MIQLCLVSFLFSFKDPVYSKCYVVTCGLDSVFWVRFLGYVLTDSVKLKK